ncbi:hypothetical protein Tco_1014984 [Tanacetum coccineum]
MPKTKSLDILSEVALTEAEQIKLATKRSKKDYHMSHASGSGDGVDIQSMVPDEQQQKVTGTNEGAGVRLEVPDVPKYTSESEKNLGHLVKTMKMTQKIDDQEEEEEEKADDDEVFYNQKVSTPPDFELTSEKENNEGDDKDKEANKDTEDAHVTLTAVPPVSHTIINIPTFVAAETPSSDTIIPQTPIPNTLPLQKTSDSTTITIPTTTLPDIPNFTSLFRFEKWVSALETKMSEFKQTSQFAKAVSSILGIVDNYLASKMKETIDLVVQLQKNKLKEEAQAENHEFLNQVDSTMKAIIKEQTSYAVAASLSEFELKKILIDKMETNKSINRSDVQKDLYKALVESYNSDKDIISSYGDVVTLKIGRDDQDKDEDPSAGSN